MKSGVCRTVESKLLAERRETHAEIFLDQLEMPVVITEQNGGIGAFSKFKFTHRRGVFSLLRKDVS